MLTPKIRDKLCIKLAKYSANNIEIFSLKVTSVVDSNLRKTSSPKPPVLTPKPNPSEIVKRLSFKRDGLDGPAVRPTEKHSAAADSESNSSKHTGDSAVVGDKKLVDDKGAIIRQDDRIVTNGIRKDVDKIPGNVTESRVSSMIAKLSNGTATKPEELTSSIKSDRQNFMSKFIKNEIVEPEEDVRDVASKSDTNIINNDENEKTLENNVKNITTLEDVGNTGIILNGCQVSSKSSSQSATDHSG